MGMLYYLSKNGEYRMILLSDRGGGMVELGDVKKHKMVQM